MTNNDINKTDKDYAKVMAKLLLKGWVMLAESCPKCGAPLFKHNNEIICPQCGKILSNESDRVKIYSEKTTPILNDRGINLSKDIDSLNAKIVRIMDMLISKIIENEYLDVTILNSYLANLNLLVDILTKLNNLKLKK
ncbi:MAG: Sjogren's syndrome/scleroderma autoantigen 1 family protein [Candidatus Asgardarchaeia archaeon]|nr:MAG: hypothetical protein DRO67_05405 [Candidatus Asgardarchaeum californiense]